MLRDYQEAYPAVEVTLFDSGGGDAAAQLLTGEPEVVVALHEHPLPPGIAYHLLRLVPLVAVVGRRHRLHGIEVTDLGKPAHECFLECVPADAGLRAQVDAAFHRARCRTSPASRRRSASWYALRGARTVAGSMPATPNKSPVSMLRFGESTTPRDRSDPYRRFTSAYLRGVLGDWSDSSTTGGKETVRRRAVRRTPGRPAPCGG
ncbi:LysR substrate-binding domain-containing protein [Streptomyces sp. NPDC005476]|uniref:LysR substrate-binding domain-containing protein n=1 Tax=Streptomyces sp. NPDC005476 TaxID=3156882 RepID=UPI003455E316